jgi:HAD superfamily hydrolase (TIGR01509 family)
VPIHALIFDFDGLMVDTESPAWESWRSIYADYGVDLHINDYAATLGANDGFDPHLHLVGLLERQAPELAAAAAAARDELLERRKRLKDEMSAGLGLLPGVAELLREARAQALPLAVASSSSRRWVEGWLERLAVRHHFNAVLTADDVRQTKPAPDLFLAAAEQLGRAPQRCLVLEDSPNGIRAAHAAGCPVVAVPGAVARQLPIPPATLQLNSLSETRLDQLLRLA